MKRVSLGWKVVAGVVTVIFALFSTTCSRPVADVPKVKIGIQLSPAMGLLMVAKDRGHFRREGVDVELQGFSAGKFALQAFLGGSLDFAVAGEVPVTLASLQGNKMTIVTQVVAETRDEVRLVARRDRSFNEPATYFKADGRRKLATSVGGGPEFFTYRFLKEYGIPKSVVDIVPLKPEEMPAALTSKAVDAIAIFDPFAFIAERQLGDQSVTFTAKSYSEFYVWVCRSQDVSSRRDVLDRLLRALVSAQADMAQHPVEAQQIVVNYTKLTPEVVAGIWKNFVFAPALTQKLVDTMKAEADWAREKGDIPLDRAIPDFRKQVINEDPLRAVANDAVRLD